MVKDEFIDDVICHESWFESKARLLLNYILEKIVNNLRTTEKKESQITFFLSEIFYRRNWFGKAQRH